MSWSEVELCGGQSDDGDTTTMHGLRKGGSAALFRTETRALLKVRYPFL